ncbi:bzip transcription factor [Anaeramoeba flamelloides]|uniref:Bzip transcription factor n=1 Tax=Anaeramoeba flamelloides TaxID=1746091 RepID=A0AAV7YVD2_9EUKA|nr:bzip transcription factor [Anaeramoeba flamelloides]
MDFLSDNLFLDPYFCDTHQTQTKNSCVPNDRFALKEVSEKLFNESPKLYDLPSSDPNSDANSNLLFNDEQRMNKKNCNENKKNKNQNNKSNNEQKMNSMLSPLGDLGTGFDLEYPDLSLLGDVSNEDEIEIQLAKLLGIDENQFKKDKTKNVTTINRENTNPNLTKAKELVIPKIQKKKRNSNKKTKKKKILIFKTKNKKIENSQTWNKTDNQEMNDKNSFQKRYNLRNMKQPKDSFNLIWMINEEDAIHQEKLKKKQIKMNNFNLQEKSNGLEIKKKKIQKDDKTPNPSHRKRTFTRSNSKKTNYLKKKQQQEQEQQQAQVQEEQQQKKKRTNKASLTIEKKRSELAKITDVKQVRKLPEKEKRLRRLEKNREAARKIREKKRLELENLKQRIVQLEKENSQFQEQLKLKDKEIFRLQNLCKKNNIF